MLCTADFKKYAEDHLPKAIIGYYNTGSDSETTLSENEKAFERYILRDLYSE